MSRVSSGVRKIKTAKLNQNKMMYFAINRNALPFFGAFAGVLISVPLSVALLSSMVRADVAYAASHLASQSVAMLPADNLSCVAPAGITSASGSPSNSPITSKSSSQPGSSSYPSKPGKPSKQFITKLVGGVFVKNTATINAGPHSKNTIVQKTTVTNSNYVTVNSSNPQSATSGDATVKASGKDNSGNATSGNASNKNDTDVTLYVNN